MADHMIAGFQFKSWAADKLQYIIHNYTSRLGTLWWSIISLYTPKSYWKYTILYSVYKQQYEIHYCDRYNTVGAYHFSLSSTPLAVHATANWGQSVVSDLQSPIRSVLGHVHLIPTLLLLPPYFVHFLPLITWWVIFPNITWHDIEIPRDYNIKCILYGFLTHCESTGSTSRIHNQISLVNHSYQWISCSNVHHYTGSWKGAPICMISTFMIKDANNIFLFNNHGVFNFTCITWNVRLCGCM